MLTNIVTQEDDIFQIIKERTTFPEVFQIFHGGEVKRNKTYCPFHKEKTPSFHIYENGFFCYGCGEAGDSVAFVAKLLDLRPLEAAKAIADCFGIPVDNRSLSKEDKLRLAQEKALRLREKQLRQAFENWCKETGTKARVLAEAIRSVLDEKGVEVGDDLLSMVHLLSLFEYWADTLNMGTDEEKMELYRNPDVKGWLLCGS